MPFKVIKTIEDGEELISAIPDGWEQKGILWWPAGPSATGKKLEKLRSNEHTVPDNSWNKMPCVLKKGNISTYREALLLEKKLNDVNTENENDIINPPALSNRRTRMETHVLDFNELITEDIDTEGAVGCCSTAGSVDEVDNHANIDFADQVQQTTGKESKIDEISSLLTKLANSFEAFKTEVSVKQDKILQILQNSAPPKAPPKAAMHLANVGEFPLASIDELEEFNKKLNDAEFKNDILAQMNKIAGTDGKCNGDKIAFIIADKMFERQVLTELTWTGFSRTGRVKKAFNVYKNIIQLFYEIVHDADNAFTEKKAEDFFKEKILKHANARSKVKVIDSTEK
uniref:DUF4806 domain-containing protein n=1 Tax=Phlebotomus papatasi TaxID=29031 RepID=A0A1B0DGN7_PHLPP